MSLLIELAGEKIGRLTVIDRVGSDKNKNALWRCLCDCGREVTVKGSELKKCHTRSCGCLQRDTVAARNRSHGMSKTAEYETWSGIIKRCDKTGRTDSHLYSDKGITVCDRWRSFENFIADMGPKPSSSHSIERNDSNKNYCPENCRWATATEQARNTSRNHYLEFGGQTKCIAEWAEITGIRRSTIWVRLQRGWSVERALTEPARPMRSYGDPNNN